MKKICFGTLLHLMYQAKGAGVTYKSICDEVFKAYGAHGMDTRDDSLPGHLKTGHDNVPPDVIDAVRHSTASDAIKAFNKNVIELILDEKGFVYAVKAVLKEDDISNDTIIGYAGYDKKTIIEKDVFQMAPLLASLFKYAIADISNRDCINNLKDFGKNYLSSVDTSAPLFINQMSQEDDQIDEFGEESIQRTMTDESFARTFRKIAELKVPGNTHPSTATIYRADLTNRKFRFKELKKFLLRNIASYVYSRTETKDILSDENPAGLYGANALVQFMKVYKDNAENVLGELLLYVFLEHELNAPKILSKIELSKSTGLVSKSDGIHLFSTSEFGKPFFQLVFGASDITGTLEEAVDRAFSKILSIESNVDLEFTTVENASHKQYFDKDQSYFLQSIMVPKKNYSRIPDMAFGMFLGYSLKLDYLEPDSAKYYSAAEEKLNRDIESIQAYIIQKIKENALEGYSFYCYVLPFNDAPIEKTSIIDEIIGGE